ncbi:MAG: beta-L-arabinofuranosidase domain-containing protein, partial [Bacteroidales bacterium]
MKQIYIYTLALVFLLFCCANKKSDVQSNLPVDFSKVKIEDNFWLPRIKKHAEITIPAVIRQNEVETHRIENFKIAAGLDTGEFKGLFYDDSDLYKVIEGCAYSLVNEKNPSLEAKMDEIIAIIAAAQQPDGYLSTYFLLCKKGERWTDMDKHEMYCCGHLIEAAVAYYNATGKETLLDVAKKYADCICSTFGYGKRDWVPGHPEIELALIKLFKVTREEKYLSMAHYLLEQRGRQEGTWTESVRDYYQDLLPVSQLTKISGHAVRAMYLFTGMADYCSTASDTTYIGALNRLWDDVVLTKMYVTGGIGSSQHNEGFTDSYDLPNAEAYCETCASIGMVFWNQRMNGLFGGGKYADIMERSMFNGVLAGEALSMDKFFYVNPLESDGNHHRRPWYGTACCPSNVSRFIPSVGNYIYAVSKDAIWLNSYIGSETIVELANEKVGVALITDYPWNGEVRVVLTPERSKNFTLKMRLPSWCEKYLFTVNGKPC